MVMKIVLTIVSSVAATAETLVTMAVFTTATAHVPASTLGLDRAVRRATEMIMNANQMAESTEIPALAAAPIHV